MNVHHVWPAGPSLIYMFHRSLIIVSASSCAEACITMATERVTVVILLAALGSIIDHTILDRLHDLYS